MTKEIILVLKKIVQYKKKSHNVITEFHGKSGVSFKVCLKTDECSFKHTHIIYLFTYITTKLKNMFFQEILFISQ